MKRDELLKWFSEELLPEIVRTGNFVDDEKFQAVEKCQFEETENYVSSFASEPAFAKLTLRTPQGCRSRDVLVKFQYQDSCSRVVMRSIAQYFNEVFFYNRIKPGLVEFLRTCGRPDLADQIMPKCHFASHGNGEPEKAIIILEDLRSAGYRLSDSVLDLDLKHCLASVAVLARFHAISFAMKFRNWTPFDTLKTSFLNVWLADSLDNRKIYRDFHEQVVHRGIDYLLFRKQLPDEYLENFRKMLHPIFDVCKNLSKPSEPLSVICHGDFNRNNILYKYVNGEIADVKLIDYQKYFYGSPCLDLGLFVYLNTSLEFREKHFDHLFGFYYQTLVETVSVLLFESETSIADRIPIGMFREEFGRVAAHSYVTTSFFLPMMMERSDENFMNDLKYKTYLENGEKNLKKGGEAASRKIAEVIVDFYKRGFYK